MILEPPSSAPQPAQQINTEWDKRNLVLLLAAGACLGATSGIFETSFNNFLSATYSMGATERGLLELPREMPGFLVALSVGLIAGWRNYRAGALATAAIGLGLLGLGYLSPTFQLMTIWMVLWSIGVHVYMPLESALALSLAQKGQSGRRLGQLDGIKTAATIVGAGLVWIGTDYISTSFSTLYTTGGLLAIAAALFLLNMRSHATGPKPAPVRFVWRKEYRLYYILSILYGARKQVFLTFGPWLLIRVLQQPASTIAKLWIIAAVLGAVFRPALGRLIDKIGERKVLMADAALVAIVCLGYGFAPTLGWGVWGVRLAYACYIADLLLAATVMARTVYLYRISVAKEDLTPTLSLGISLDHAVAMTIPLAVGLLWESHGYTIVFIVAALLALGNLFTASFIKPAATTS